MAVKIVVEMTNQKGFNNDSHLDNFLDYLYRTDKAQKHTNKNTEFCVASFHIDGELKTIPFGDMRRRLELKEVSSNLVEAYGLNASTLIYDIVYLSFTDDRERNVRGEMTYEDVVSSVTDVISKREDLSRCLFHVAHLDRGDYHIHSVMTI